MRHFIHLSSVCYGNTSCLRRKRVKLLEMTHKTDGKQMQLGKQCMDSNQWQICSSAPPSNIYEHVIFIKESKDHCHYLLKLLFCLGGGGGGGDTLKILHEDLFHMAVHSDHVCQDPKRKNTKKHHKCTLKYLSICYHWTPYNAHPRHCICIICCTSHNYLLLNQSAVNL